MNKKQAFKIVGGLSRPGKMPCKGYSLPAQACKTGSKLMHVKNSVCADCYAMKGMYRFKNTKDALRKRLDSLVNPLWAKAMVTLIQGMPFFRWHDSGDLQSLGHLLQIVIVCQQTPATRHWLPTREKGILREYLTLYKRFPGNLTIRLSDTLVDAFEVSLPVGVLSGGVHTVERDKTGVHYCPAHKQDNQCKQCRACWDKSVPRVSYLKH